jgi:hypothetical protein
MKNSNQILAVGLLVVFMVGCAQNASKEEAAANSSAVHSELAKADSISTVEEKTMSSSAAVVNKDTSRKFIRTADLRFKVKNVIASTYRIEDIVNHFDGFVTHTHLASNIDHRMIIPVSADSSLECTYYTVINNMTIRVPNTQLDTTLKSMAYLVDFMDSRLIKADDISLSMLSNRMAEKRLNEYQKRLKNAIDEHGKKLNETSNAEENLLDKQEKADNATLSNIDLKDKVSYSTVTLNIYQSQSVKRELIENDKNIESYKPGFLHQIKEAIEAGWIVFEYIVLFIMQMWGVILIGIVIYFVVRRFLLKKK